MKRLSVLRFDHVAQLLSLIFFGDLYDVHLFVWGKKCQKIFGIHQKENFSLHRR